MKAFAKVAFWILLAALILGGLPIALVAPYAERAARSCGPDEHSVFDHDGHRCEPGVRP